MPFPNENYETDKGLLWMVGMFLEDFFLNSHKDNSNSE